MIYIPHSVPSSKNSRIRTKSGKFIVSKAVRLWRANTLKDWSEKRFDFLLACSSVETEPLLIGFHFIRHTKHKYDFINPAQTIQDEMVTHKWIQDDNVDIMFPFPMLVNGSYTTFNKENAGVLIKVFKTLDEITINYKYDFDRTR